MFARLNMYIYIYTTISSASIQKRETYPDPTRVVSSVKTMHLPVS